MTNVLWTCPYCNRACTLQDSDIKYLTDKVTLSKDHGAVYGNIQFKICPNPECRKISIVSRIWRYNYQTQETGQQLYEWFLVPESNAKPFPDYIPQQLRIPTQVATRFRFIPPPDSDLSRHRIPKHFATPWEVRKGRWINLMKAAKAP